MARRPDSHRICTESGGVEYIVVLQGDLEVPAGELLVERFCFQSLVGEMYVPKALSDYNLLALSLSDLTPIYFCRSWLMSFAEIQHPLIFGFSFGWNLGNTMGFFCTFNV